MKAETTCERCHWRYPRLLLQPMSSSAGTTGPICGICALDYSNELLGTHRKKFTGFIAEEFRHMALNWRHRHPDLAPAQAQEARP